MLARINGSTASSKPPPADAKSDYAHACLRFANRRIPARLVREAEIIIERGEDAGRDARSRHRHESAEDRAHDEQTGEDRDVRGSAVAGNERGPKAAHSSEPRGDETQTERDENGYQPGHRRAPPVSVHQPHARPQRLARPGPLAENHGDDEPPANGQPQCRNHSRNGNDRDHGSGGQRLGRAFGEVIVDVVPRQKPSREKAGDDEQRRRHRQAGQQNPRGDRQQPWQKAGDDAQRRGRGHLVTPHRAYRNRRQSRLFDQANRNEQCGSQKRGEKTPRGEDEADQIGTVDDGPPRQKMPGDRHQRREHERFEQPKQDGKPREVVAPAPVKRPGLTMSFQHRVTRPFVAELVKVPTRRRSGTRESSVNCHQPSEFSRIQLHSTSVTELVRVPPQTSRLRTLPNSTTAWIMFRL